MNRIDQIAERYADLQQEICQTLESADGKGKFGKRPVGKN